VEEDYPGKLLIPVILKSLFVEREVPKCLIPAPRYAGSSDVLPVEITREDFINTVEIIQT
jgi:hypothetical protein